MYIYTGLWPIDSFLQGNHWLLPQYAKSDHPIQMQAEG